MDVLLLLLLLGTSSILCLPSSSREAPTEEEAQSFLAFLDQVKVSLTLKHLKTRRGSPVDNRPLALTVWE